MNIADLLPTLYAKIVVTYLKKKCLLGIKESGSLQNPKPFTVRFRIMCMAEVLWFAVDSGLKTSVCLKAINTVKQPLMMMLEDILQVTYALNNHKLIPTYLP